MSYQEKLCRIFLKERHVYFEPDSLFKVLGILQSGTTKPKYKLFCRKSILDMYFFLTTTSNEYATDPALSINVQPADWENPSFPFDKEGTCICFYHFDVMTFADILTKVTTRRFSDKGTLTESKFKELKQKYVTNREKLKRTKLDALNIADFAILGVDSGVSDSLTRLGLN